MQITLLNNDWVKIAVSLIMSGGAIAAVREFFKLKAETGSITITAAENAVLIQERLVKSLHRELRRSNRERHRCERRFASIERVLETHGIRVPHEREEPEEDEDDEEEESES